MRKMIIAAVVLLLLTASLGGCANVDGEYTFESTDDYETSSSDNKTLDVSSDSIGEIPSKCKIYKQKVKNFTENQLLSLFSETPKRTYYNETNTAVYVSSSERGNTDGTDLNFITDSGMLCAMSYDTIGSPYSEQSEIVNLDFAAFDKVLEAVEKQMSQFGFSLNEWFVNEVYTVKAEDLDRFKETQYNAAQENPYSLDESELQKEIEQASRINKYPSKDSYYIDIKFKINDIKMYTGNGLAYGENSGYRVLGSSCQIVYSKDGFERISIYNVCETETSEDAEIIAPEKAQELLNKKFNDIIFNGEIEAYNIELIYMPIPQENFGDYANRFETRPFYAFYYTLTEKNNGETTSGNVITYFDAITGDEFATERIATGIVEE